MQAYLGRELLIPSFDGRLTSHLRDEKRLIERKLIGKNEVFELNDSIMAERCRSKKVRVHELTMMETKVLYRGRL
jgi:hypothetical protein